MSAASCQLGRQVGRSPAAQHPTFARNSATSKQRLWVAHNKPWRSIKSNQIGELLANLSGRIFLARKIMAILSGARASKRQLASKRPASKQTPTSPMLLLYNCVNFAAITNWYYGMRNRWACARSKCSHWRSSCAIECVREPNWIWTRCNQIEWARWLKSKIANWSGINLASLVHAQMRPVVMVKYRNAN